MDELGDVLAAFAQRGDRDRDHGEPEVQIAPEPASLTLLALGEGCRGARTPAGRGRAERGRLSKRNGWRW